MATKKAGGSKKGGGAKKGGSAKKGAVKKAASKRGSGKKQARSSGKRTLVENKAGAFYAKRDESGQFSEMDERGRSLAADRRQPAKTKVKSGYGDRGDQQQKIVDGKAGSKGASKGGTKPGGGGLPPPGVKRRGRK